MRHVHIMFPFWEESSFYAYIKRLPVLRAITLHVHIMFHIWKETSFYAHNISTLLYKYTFIHTLFLFLFLVHICALEPNDISRNFVTAILSVNNSQYMYSCTSNTAWYYVQLTSNEAYRVQLYNNA